MSPLTAKISGLIDLTAEDSKHLDSLSDSPRFYCSGSTIIEDGDNPDDVYLMVKGWSGRYKADAHGDRQIVALLLPGDLCDVYTFILQEMDHSIVALGDAEVAVIPKEIVLGMIDQSPAIARGVWWSNLVDEAILREWLLNVGQRSAERALAHLLCEIWFRMSMIGEALDGYCYFPLTQDQIGSALGLTPVHVNRKLRDLRHAGAATVSQRRLRVDDWRVLSAIADFSPRYLHSRGAIKARA